MKKVINPNTPDFVDPAQRHGIDTYLGEDLNNIKLIEQTIMNHRAVLIDAPTGTGKSTVTSYIFKKWIQEGRRCYYLLPKIIQQQQFSKRYLKDIPMINASATKEDKAEARRLGANITWQGFLSSKYDQGLTKNDLVIVDETHLMINNQSYINDTKKFVQMLQRGKYHLVFLSGTPNFIALKDLFGCEIVSFYLKNPPVRTIKPYIIKGALMNNVMHYLRSQDFSEIGLHVIRVNDKDKHHELAQWAVDTLHLSPNEIQMVNSDIADPRWLDKDYQYLLDKEAIDPSKKLLLTTIFADEAISINNTNIKSIGIFYDPYYKFKDQRCRDSAVQFCSRFRNIHKIDNYDNFSINMFLPELPEGRETLDYHKVFSINEKTTKYLLRQLAQTRKYYGANGVMQVLPHLIEGSDPQRNLVIEVGDKFFKANRQGIYFNTKNQIDCFKSNEEFIEELSPYFDIQPISIFDPKSNSSDSKSMNKVKEDRLKAKIRAFKSLKDNPTDVIWAVVSMSNCPELKKIIGEFAPNTTEANYAKDTCNQHLIQGLEGEAVRLLFLKNVNYPISEFAGLLLRKRELHEKMQYLRFMLSRQTGIINSMNNLYYINSYEPLIKIINEISQKYIGTGVHPKSEVIEWIKEKMSYSLKTKGITANIIINELFVTEEKRSRVNGKKVSSVSFLRERTITDVVFDFLFYNEMYYPSYKSSQPIAEDYIQMQQVFNASQMKARSKERVNNDTTTKLGQARVVIGESGQTDHLIPEQIDHL